MSKTLADVVYETRMYLDESSSTDFLTQDVLYAVNKAYHSVVQKVMEVYDGWYDTTTPFTYAIVANEQEYTIDPTIIKITRVEINYALVTTANTSSTRAIPITSDEIRQNLANTSNAGSYFSCAYYTHGNIGAQTIGFIPIPIVGDTTGKSISVWGISLPVDMVNNTDNVNIPWADNFSGLVSLKAAAQLLRKGQQEEVAARQYMADFNVGVIDMQTFLKDRQSDDGQYIEDSALEQTDFSTLEIA